MKRILYIFAAVLSAASCQRGPQMTWHRVLMDGSRTGVRSINADNVDEAVGTFEDDVYVAPNGSRFTGGATPEVAAALIKVQPKMRALKQVIGFASEPMAKKAPESTLSNWFVDVLRAKGEEIFGVPMDFAISNFGGIRCDLPAGPVIKDDIESMFPFRNYVVYATVPGAQLRRLFDQLALTDTFQCISGAKVVVKDHKVVSAEIGNEPLDDARTYNVTTIDFLLSGGDRIAIGAMATDVRLSKVLLKEMMLEEVARRTAAEEPIAYFTDGRVVMEN